MVLAGLQIRKRFSAAGHRGPSQDRSDLARTLLAPQL